MTSIEERLQIKREPLDKWSIREQLCLAVARNSDQNLTSVSRALKPFGEPNRPSDWFHQKNCAAQYGALLANFETPKRKKRTPEIETPAEAILRQLLNERKAELKKLLAEEKAEYAQLQQDMALLTSGSVTEDQLDTWCREIDDEERQKEQEALAHELWLKEREQRKLEIERQWRPVKPAPPRRKNSDCHDNVAMDIEEEAKPPEQPKPALSPLLTSLLKSPSQSTSILQSAITRPANPTIASLLSSSTNVQVSPGLQQLVSTAIGQDTLEDSIDDLASSILIEGGPLPEIKNDVDVIISDLIESAQEIVSDPEQHLQLDGNGDVNLELEEFETKVEEVKKEEEEKAVVEEAKVPSIDPFEFQDEIEAFEPKPPAKCEFKQVQVAQVEKEVEKSVEEAPKAAPVEDVKEEQVQKEEKEELQPENVETMEEEAVQEPVKQAEEPKTQEDKVEDPPEAAPEEKTTESDSADVKPEETIEEKKNEAEETKEADFNDELYDDVNMEVKIDKTGKAKRDYSRTKKKEEKDFDVLLTIEKASDELGDDYSDYTNETEKKELKTKVKSETDRSNSPWTEEEEVSLKTRRRLSTPCDSVPNSPVSSSFFLDDDKEYKNWKKSVMLVYNRLATNKYASLFTKPITDDQAPGYHGIVYRPMDLQTIRKNIETGVIRTTQHFQRDVLLMLQNAIMYNKTNDTVYNMARQMQQEAVQQIEILLQAQTDTPARRETRMSEPGVVGMKRKRGSVSLIEEQGRKKRKED